MLNVKQLADHVVRPVLQSLGMDSGAAFLLLLGTAAQESNFAFIRQVGGGPALGLWQMEPATHDDIALNYLSFRPELRDRILAATGACSIDSAHLISNLAYACAFARLHYYRVPSAIPETLDGQADYWKSHYNTYLGAGTVEEYCRNFRTRVAPALARVDK